ncbi:MAG TPA: DUF3368 domain-containing protein [Verrucomicrobiae bacterium]
MEFNLPILLDEREAREIAKEKGLLVIGTIGLLERAAQQNLIHLAECFAALQKTNMRMDQTLLDSILARLPKKS